MITLEEQQKIAANFLKQPTEKIKELAFVDKETNILCLVSAFDKNKNLLTKEQLKNYKGGFILLVGSDGGVLTGGSAFSVSQLIKKYIQGERVKGE